MNYIQNNLVTFIFLFYHCKMKRTTAHRIEFLFNYSHLLVKHVVITTELVTD